MPLMGLRITTFTNSGFQFRNTPIEIYIDNNLIGNFYHGSDSIIKSDIPFGIHRIKYNAPAYPPTGDPHVSITFFNPNLTQFKDKVGFYTAQLDGTQDGLYSTGRYTDPIRQDREIVGKDLDVNITSELYNSQRSDSDFIAELTDVQLFAIIDNFLQINEDPIKEAGALQLKESYGRNDITIEQLRIYVTKLGSFSKEDIENLNPKLPFDPNQLISNIDILLDQFENRVNTMSQVIKNIQSGNFDNLVSPNQDPNQLGGLDTRSLTELMKEQLDGLINDTIPRIINNLNGQFAQADQYLIDVTIYHERYDLLNQTFIALRSLGAGIIDNSQGLIEIGNIAVTEVRRVFI